MFSFVALHSHLSHLKLSHSFMFSRHMPSSSKAIDPKWFPLPIIVAERYQSVF